MSDTPAWKQRLEELEQYVENLSKTKPPAWAVERAKEIAESIFAEWQASCARHPEGYPSPMGLIVERHIAAALTIPDGHVRLPSGKDVPYIPDEAKKNALMYSRRIVDRIREFLGDIEFENDLHKCDFSLRGGVPTSMENLHAAGLNITDGADPAEYVAHIRGRCYDNCSLCAAEAALAAKGGGE